MLSILLIYFIGKQFYELAQDFNKNRWLFAILGVIVYYAIGILLVVVIALLDVAVFEWGFDWENRFGMNLLAIPLGLLADVSLYFFLKNRWKATVVLVKDEIQDIGKSTEE